MSDPYATILLAIFAIHLAAFFRLYIKHRKTHFFIFSLVFTLLVLSYAMRLWLPQVHFYGHTAYTYLRVAAWLITPVALVAYLKYKWGH